MNEYEAEQTATVLDAERGIQVYRVAVSGKKRPILKQGPLRMILTDEIIEKLAIWNEQQGDK